MMDQVRLKKLIRISCLLFSVIFFMQKVFSEEKNLVTPSKTVSKEASTTQDRESQKLVIDRFKNGVDDLRDKISIKAEVDQAVATTSDIIKLTITLTKPNEFSDLTVPEIGGSLAGLRVIEFGEEDPKKEDKLVLLKKWYKLQADISGSYIIPAVKLDYVDSSGNRHKAETSEIFVEVQPLISSGEKTTKEKEELKDIRDIKDLASIGLHPLWKLAAVIGTIGVLIGVIFLLLKFLRKKESPNIVISPYEIALQKLRDLQRGSFENPADYKRYFFELSEITRAYFEGRFDFPATDRTTEELNQEISRMEDLSGEHSQLFIKILKEADKVKFMDYLSTQPKTDETLKKALHFIESTKPTPTIQDTGEEEVEESII